MAKKAPTNVICSLRSVPFSSSRTKTLSRVAALVARSEITLIWRFFSITWSEQRWAFQHPTVPTGAQIGLAHYVLTTSARSKGFAKNGDHYWHYGAGDWAQEVHVRLQQSPRTSNKTILIWNTCQHDNILGSFKSLSVCTSRFQQPKRCFSICGRSSTGPYKPYTYIYTSSQ